MTTIRRIRVDEALAVRELYRESVREAAERHPEDRLEISEQGLDNLETHFRLGAVHEDVITLVAEDDGEFVGFVLAEVERGRSLPGAAGQVAELWTGPGRRQLREELVREAIRLLRERGAGPIFHTDDAKDPEREPWESLGFAPDVVRFSLYPSAS
jgi:predicted N-acetyltransferase YhbS